MMQVYVTDEPMPASDATIEAAAGAVILHGIPPRYTDVIPAGTLGLCTVPDDEPEPEPPLDSTAVLTAVQTARTSATTAKVEVSGFSQNSGTRQAVEALIASNEALADAVEVLLGL